MLRRMLDALVPGKRRRGRQTTRWTCQEKGRRARAKKNVRCTSTRKETERKKTRWKDSYKKYVKCGVKGGGCTGRDKVEEINTTHSGDPDDGKSLSRRNRPYKKCLAAIWVAVLA